MISDAPTQDLQVTLRDLMDIDAFQHLTETFTRLTGLATAILDLDGTVLTGSGWQKICTEFHRLHPTTLERCRESDTVLANQSAEEHGYNLYKCKNGLYDVAVPIVIENIHVGNIFTGQFLFEPPDPEFFRQQARSFGFEESAYLELLHQVPVVSREQVEQTLEFLSNLTTIIASAGIDRKRLLQLNQELEQRIARRTGEIRAERTFSDSLINSLPGVMYVFDRLGRFRRWNRNFETITGYSPDQIRSLNPLDLFCGNDEKNRVKEAIETVFREGSATVEADLCTREGREIPYLFTGYHMVESELDYVVGVGLDISERLQAEHEKEILIGKLQQMLLEVKQLSGLLPICASCKNIRDDEGYWKRIEQYIEEHSEAEFSHSLCPDCAEKLYPDLVKPKTPDPSG